MIKKIFRGLGITDSASFWRFAGQFLKFGLVGLSSTAISVTVYYVLLLFSVHYLIANLAAFVISVMNAYYWNSKYVFTPAADGAKKGGLTFVKVFAVYGFTFLLSSLLLFVMIDMLNVSKWIAPVFSLCVTIPLNFLLNKFWAFK